MVSYSVGEFGLLFVESKAFTAQVRELLDDATYRALQGELLRNPNKGAVMPHCGGLRKVRVEQPARGKGKRSGCRVIYLHIPKANRIDLLAIYTKDKQDTLSREEQRILKALVEEARAAAVRRAKDG